MKVLVADPLSDAGLEALRRKGIEVEVRTGLKEAELAKALSGFDGLIVRSGVQVTAAVIAASNGLRVIGRAGTGVDNIDLAAATEKGILVVNTPAGNTLSAAEHTFALLLSLARRVPQAAASIRSGAWDRNSFAGVELHGKTLGIVGLGRIGREVASRARAFGMRIVAFDPYIHPDVAKGLGAELSSLDDLLPQADFLTIHTPLTDETTRLLGPAEIARLKRGAYVLNVARGGLVDEVSLAQALSSGAVAGAAFDVFATEPPKSSPLVGLPNFIGTPHLGASTQEAQERVALQVAEIVSDYLADGRITNAVNMPHPVEAALAPYVELAWGMGAFAAQWATGRPTSVRVTCRGEVARHDTHAIAVAALAGVLARSTEGTNLINAERRAQEHGLRFVQAQTETIEDYAASVEVILDTSQGATTLLGTSLARLGPRIVRIGDYDVEFKPHGRFLVVQHRDQPGTVAKISTVLGKANVNIAQMVVGRLEARGPAVSILRVDDPVPETVLAQIREALGVREGVRYVTIPRLGLDANE